MLLDPFSDKESKLTCAHFTSTNVFDDEHMRENDVIIKAVAQCSKQRVDDEDYKIYIWMQMHSNLIRSKMLDPNSFN